MHRQAFSLVSNKSCFLPPRRVASVWYIMQISRPADSLPRTVPAFQAVYNWMSGKMILTIVYALGIPDSDRAVQRVPRHERPGERHGSDRGRRTHVSRHRAPQIPPPSLRLLATTPQIGGLLTLPGVNQPPVNLPSVQKIQDYKDFGPAILPVLQRLCFRF